MEETKNVFEEKTTTKMSEPSKWKVITNGLLWLGGAAVLTGVGGICANKAKDSLGGTAVNAVNFIARVIGDQISANRPLNQNQSVYGAPSSSSSSSWGRTTSPFG